MTNYHSDPQEKDWKLARWWRQSLWRTCGGNKQTQSFRFFPRAHYREYSKTLSRHKTGLFSRQNFSAGAHNPERETSFESSGITAFSRARLFLNRFWREFKTSFRSHKPESRVRSRRSDGGERVNSYVGKTRGDFPLVFFFPRQYFAHALRSERLEKASIKLQKYSQDWARNLGKRWKIRSLQSL